MKLRFLCLLAVTAGVLVRAQGFDLVLANGRVIDSATGSDSVRDVGIRSGKIAAIAAPGTLRGKEVEDVSGLVVTSGFIDLHQHGQTDENYRFKAQDGVTTALEMEVGVYPVDDWYRQREGKSLINFGATVGHIPVRMHVLDDSGTFLPRDKAVETVANQSQRQQILDDLRKGLDQGALGIGMGLAYTPGAGPEEILPVFNMASGHQVPVFVHLRSAGPVKPGGIEALEEVMAYAAASGSSLHVVHLTSTLLRNTGIGLQLIEGAKKHGLDFSTESYPYTAGMTEIESAIFSDGWQGRNGGISYGDLQWAATGERLTEKSFAKYRKEGGMVAIHSIPEEVAKEAVGDPNVMVASDGILDHGKGHPRAAGTYARVLAKYVRQEHVLTLGQALRKMSYLPAERAGLHTKGRMQVGADADITVFDAARVQDRATYEDPAQASAGIPIVLVNGIYAVKNGRTTNAHPGMPQKRIVRN